MDGSSNPLDRLDERSVVLETTDPHADLTDLDALRDVLEDVSVVGMGEATHGTREFFVFKHRLFRFLVEELGFRLFVLEANFAETLAVDDYVVRGEGTPEAAIDGLGFWTWNTEEVLALVEWIRAFNEDRPPDDRVRFYGLDVQFTAGPARALDEYLATVEPEWGGEIREMLAALVEDDIRNADGDAVSERLPRIERLLSALRDRFDDRRDPYVEATDAEGYELAARHLRTLERAVEYNRGMHEEEVEESIAIRDLAMAENVSWILDREPHDRIALWAHNDHVARGSISYEGASADALGAHLGRAFGDRYYALGFDFVRGSFRAIDDTEDGGRELRRCSVGKPVADSVAELLSELGGSLRFVDVDPGSTDTESASPLDEERPMRTIGALFFGEDDDRHRIDRHLSETFDGLLLVEETKHAVPIEA